MRKKRETKIGERKKREIKTKDQDKRRGQDLTRQRIKKKQDRE